MTNIVKEKDFSHIFTIFIYGLGLITVNGLTFILLPIYTHLLTPSQYAQMTLIITLLPLTRYCLSLEISQAVPLFAVDNPKQNHLYISTGFWFNILIQLLFYFLIILFNSTWHFLDFNNVFILSISLLFIIDALYYYTSNIVRWQLKHLYYNSVIISSALLETTIIITLLYFYHMGVIGVFYAWLIGRSFGLFFMWHILKNQYQYLFDITLLKKMLQFSCPLVISNIIYNCNKSFDRWIMISLFGLTSTGIYAAGATLSGIVNLIMSTLSTSLTPTIYQARQKENKKTDIIKLFYFITATTFIITLIFTVFNAEILSLLLAINYAKKLMHSPIIAMTFLTAIISGLTFFAPGIAIKKKTHLTLLINGLTFFVNCLLAFVLTKLIGFYGILLATLIASSFNTFFYMKISQQYYALPFTKPHLYFYFICLSLFYLSSIWINAITPIYTFIAWRIGFILGAISIFWILLNYYFQHLNQMNQINNDHLLMDY